MVMYSGEDIEVRVLATKPVTGRYVVDATVIAEFYAPGKDPENSLVDRAAPNSTTSLAYVPSERAYVGISDTEGWIPGKWSVRASLSGTVDSMAFSTFILHV